MVNSFMITEPFDVLLVHGEVGQNPTSPFDSMVANKTYKRLWEMFDDESMSMAIVSPTTYDRDELKFSGFWCLNRKTGSFEHTEHLASSRMLIDRFYDKSLLNIKRHTDEHFFGFNGIEVDVTCKDKLAASQILTHHIPTALDPVELLDVVAKNKTIYSQEYMIKKPRFGRQSEGVTLVKLGSDDCIYSGNNYVFQPFLQTKKYFGNKKVHDIRLFVRIARKQVEPTLLGAELRQPYNETEMFITKNRETLAYNNRTSSLCLNDILTDVHGAYHNLSQRPGLLAVDIGVSDEGTPFIFEINTKPCLYLYENGKTKDIRETVLEQMTYGGLYM